MKTNNIIKLTLLILLTSCSSNSHWKVLDSNGRYCINYNANTKISFCRSKDYMDIVYWRNDDQVFSVTIGSNDIRSAYINGTNAFHTVPPRAVPMYVQKLIGTNFSTGFLIPTHDKLIDGDDTNGDGFIDNITFNDGNQVYQCSVEYILKTNSIIKSTPSL